MATQKITDYERKRLENIRRNEELISSLKLQSMATQLSASTKRQRVESKSYKSDQEKKKKKKQPKTQNPIVIRRSLRTRGKSPDAKGLGDVGVELSGVKSPQTLDTLLASPGHLGPLRMEDVCSGLSSRVLIDTILGIEKKPQLGSSVKSEENLSDGVSCGLVNKEDNEVVSELNETILGVEKKPQLGGFVKTEFGIFEGCKDENTSGSVKGIVGVSCGLIKKEDSQAVKDVKLESLTLKPENIARLVPRNILNLKFFPSTNLRMIVVGNKSGNVGFWNMDYKEETESGIYMYQPHSCPISGISIPQHCMSKIFTSCYDGFIRMMDAEKEVFDLVYSSDETIYSLSQQPNNPKCLYFAEGRGGLSMWDERTGNVSAQWTPHDDRINTIDFNPQNSNIITTSSTDGTACIWDLRSNDPHKFKSLKTIGHKRAVHSAYFSPSGRSLVTTSIDDTVGISSGVNFEDISMIYHDNRQSRWIPKFKAIWGWDDAYVFIGNKNRGVDVISPIQKTTITLESPYMSAIPCRFDAHPFNVGMLAGATGGGQVYVWTLD